MPIALLVARLLLSGVFGVAGMAKLADRAGSRKGLTDFGVPSALAPALAILLPVAELAVAVALLPVSSAWFGALGALSLLLLFIFGIAINLALGLTPNCHCFGQISSAPAGWTTLARNVGLAVVSGIVVWFGWHNSGLSLVGWVGDLTIAQRLLAAVSLIGLGLLAIQGWVLQQVLRQQGRLLLRLDALDARLESAGIAPASAKGQEAPAAGLPINAPAPSFRLRGLRGEVLTLEALLAPSKPVLLFFTHPDCGPCQVLMPEISRWQRDYVSAITIVLISEGKPQANRAKSGEHRLVQVLLQKGREVAEAYQAFGTPGAVLVRPDGTIGSRLAMGADDIRALVTETFGGAPTPMAATLPSIPQNGQKGSGQDSTPPLPSAEIGQPAPWLNVRDLKGKTVRLTSFRGRETLLLFWNPACGFCQQMLDDLKRWEANPPPDAPKLLVISSGTVEDNLAMDLRSTVVLDSNFRLGSAFGANGTPMGVLLDSKGRIASEVAAGAQAVLELAGAKQNETTETK